MLDYHDDWNLIAIGALNIAQVAWWIGLLPGAGMVTALFAADAAYLVADTCWVWRIAFKPATQHAWPHPPREELCIPYQALTRVFVLAHVPWPQLAFVPTCVPAQARRGLLMHHLVACCCLPVAAGKPLLMTHLLRTWIVELQSWTHIAARRLQHKAAAAIAQRINRPLFFAFRIVAFPLTWIAYERSRASLPAPLRLAQAPLSVHVPLSLLHLGMYGLMLNWGRSLLLRSS